MDILGSWLPGEKFMARNYNRNVVGVPLVDLEPFWWNRPWTSALKGRNVLLVHPFEDTIRFQYANRVNLFANRDMLPDFNLKTYRTISSFAGAKTPYVSWFEALEKMCLDISKIDFDIALIGCGAYGMSIGAFIKREMGKRAVHLGGVTQLFFGIKGGRWDSLPRIKSALYNQFWVRPFDSDIVVRPDTIEGGAYW